MSKYEPLEIYLRESGREEVPMTFGEVEQIIERVNGKKLPSSAFKHSQWWENDSSSPYRQAHAWLRAGYKTENVDMAGRKLVFCKSTM